MMKAFYAKTYSRVAKAFAVVALLTATVAVQAQEYFQRLSMEGVELIGAVTWGKVDEFTYMDAGYYEFSYDNKFSPDKTAPLYRATPLGGCAYHDGKIYSCEYTALNQKVKPMWRIYDAKTFKLLSEHQLKDNCESTTTCITYDPTTGNMYGLLETFTETFLVKINPETGDMERVGEMLDYLTYTKYLAIACSPTGTIYCTYLNRNTDAISLGKFRKSTGQVSLVKGISATNLLPGDSFINGAYEQSLFFNNATGKMYWMFQGSSAMLYKEVTQIYEVNPTTADAVMVAYTEDQLQGPGAFFLEPKLEAPAIIENFAWTPNAVGSCNGNISFSIPTQTYGAKTLSGEVQYTVTLNGEEFCKGTATPGQKITKAAENMPNKWNEFKLTLANAAGDGPTVKREVFAGYGIPKAPANARLTADGLTTTLTWDAPTEGVGETVIKTSDLTYKVVRYPGEVTVADGITATEFTESHPEDMTRYVYTVSAKADGKTGRAAMSNNIIVGKPLDVPYLCTFFDAADMYNYFTILDSNGDSKTWMYDKDGQRALYFYSMENPADDWMISPAINYEKGKTYELAFRAMSSSSTYKEDLQVTFGNDKTPVAQTQLLVDLPQLTAQGEDGAEEPHKVQFTVPADGVYYFAFHAVSAKFREYIYLWDVAVNEVKPTAISSVNAAHGFKLSTKGGRIAVEAAEGTQIAVRDMGGRTVAKADGGSLNVEAGRGVYLVSVGGKTVKAVVK